MMTWVQTQKLRRDEASLMTEWQTRWAQSACFNADGVVDYERWSALPDRKHIVVWYYKSSLVCTGKETLVVSMPHPNRAAKNWTLELEKVLRATGRL